MRSGELGLRVTNYRGAGTRTGRNAEGLPRGRRTKGKGRRARGENRGLTDFPQRGSTPSFVRTIQEKRTKRKRKIKRGIGRGRGRGKEKENTSNRGSGSGVANRSAADPEL